MKYGFNGFDIDQTFRLWNLLLFEQQHKHTCVCACVFFALKFHDFHFAALRSAKIPSNFQTYISRARFYFEEFE